jgi:hypothetical protein
MMKIPKGYLVALLNELSYLSGSIEVQSPLTGHLFTIEFGEKCKVIPVKKNLFLGERRDFIDTKNGVRIEDEVPDFNDLVTCFYSSALILSPDHQDIVNVIKEGINRELLMGKRPVFIGYDTNSPRHRMNRVVERIISSIDRQGHQKIGYCMSDVIKKELQYQWDKKYGDLEQLRMLWDNTFSRSFLNQPPLDARMAMIGAVEYMHVIANPNCEEVYSQGRGDTAIIESYSKYEKFHAVDMLLLSGDNNFTTMAHQDRIDALYLRPARHLPDEIETDWIQLIELLYCTAVIFGVISVDDVHIFGIWSGKNGVDWNRYNLKIDPGYGNYSQKMLDDVRILERMLS